MDGRVGTDLRREGELVRADAEGDERARARAASPGSRASEPSVPMPITPTVLTGLRAPALETAQHTRGGLDERARGERDAVRQPWTTWRGTSTYSP